MKSNSFGQSIDSDRNNQHGSQIKPDSSDESSDYIYDNEIILIDKTSSENERSPSRADMHKCRRLSPKSKISFHKVSSSSSSNQEFLSPIKIDKKRIKYYKEEETNSEPDNCYDKNKNELNINKLICHTDEGKFMEGKLRDESSIATELIIEEEKEVPENKTKGGLYDFADIVHRTPHFHPTFSTMTKAHQVLDLQPSVESNSPLSMIEEMKESAEFSPECYKDFIPKNIYKDKINIPLPVNYDDGNNIKYIPPTLSLSTKMKARILKPLIPKWKKGKSERYLLKRNPKIKKVMREKSSRKLVLPNENLMLYTKNSNMNILGSKERVNPFTYLKSNEKNVVQEHQLDALLKTNKELIRQLSINNQRANKNTTSPTNSSFFTSGLKW